MSTFNTERMKQLVSYSIQGAGFDKLLQLSEYMGVSIANGTLYLNTTDGMNYLCVQDACAGDDFDVTVDANLFAKLISKINTDEFELSVTESSLIIRTSAGKYTLPLKVNDAGDSLQFPDRFPTETTPVATIPAISALTISNTLKTSLSAVTGSVYANYYLGDIAATTDKAMMNIFNEHIFDEPFLFNKNFVNLMCMGNTDVEISKSADMLLAKCAITENCIISICTRIDDNVKDYNVETVKRFADLEVGSFCRIRKADLVDLLDRLVLFVGKFDDGAIQLKFTDTDIEVSSLASSGVEHIEFVESKDATPMTIKINIERLRAQLKAYTSDMVDLYYGSDVCIKLVDGKMTQIIALIK